MVLVIAEAGVNHNGSRELALELVRIAAKSGADAVKFQTFTADNLVLKGAEKADYQKKQTGDGDQHSMLKKLEMSPELHQELITLCNTLGIEFMSTAFDNDALDFLVDHGIKRIKIPSGELTNHPFIRHIASKNLPIILSTGMANLNEIIDAKQVIEDERQKWGFNTPIREVLTILHCTSNYPASPESVHLNAISTIAKATNVPIGYSDHTLGTAVSTAVVALGATVIEKHFSISKGLPGPDHAASLEPDELNKLVSDIRIVSEAMGLPEKKPTESELAVRSLVRRSITMVSDLKKGQVLKQEHITFMRPGNGIQPKELENVIGLKVKKSVSAGSTLQWADIEV